MKSFTLSSEETRQHGYTHKIVVDISDLKSASSPLKLMAIKAGQVLRATALRLDRALENIGDPQYKKCEIKLGDKEKADKYLTATETNKNGTYVKCKATNIVHAYTTDDHLLLTVETQATKSLSSLTHGQISIYVAVGDLTVL